VFSCHDIIFSILHFFCRLWISSFKKEDTRALTGPGDEKILNGEITYAVRKPSIGPFVPIPRHHTSLRGGKAESGDMVKRRTLAEIKFTMFAPTSAERV